MEVHDCLLMFYMLFMLFYFHIHKNKINELIACAAAAFFLNNNKKDV